MKVLLISGFIGTLFLIWISLIALVAPDPVESDAAERLWKIAASEETKSAKKFDEEIKSLRKRIKASENSAKIINMVEEVKRLEEEKESEFQRIRSEFKRQKAAIYLNDRNSTGE